MKDKPPLPFSVDPVTGAIHLPSDIIHELFHLAREDRAEAVRRLIELTGAGQKEAQAYVDALYRRR